MKVAILSGKGGTGKTFVAVNLAATAKDAVYVDCDVEEPNGRLFLTPTHTRETPVCKLIPEFDAAKCTGCRKCVEFCRYNALVLVRETPMVFSEVCHSCGGCALLCPENAVSEKPHPVGLVEEGRSGSVRVVTGVMNPGEASAVPVIQAALRAGAGTDKLTVIDCPPGSGCPVMESVMDADFCILAAEPTAFGFHNFKMVHRLAELLGKPCGVIINKTDAPYAPLEEYCAARGLPVLLRIPYSERLAALGAAGKIAVEYDAALAASFRGLLSAIREELAQ
ncbi:MAG: ATP-binding protein [Oscillospiraceae bacterium]|nr:ATP-binding protein [Oscillospiraceae bacterium]